MQELTKFYPSICFKGDREYIQGGDIYDAINEYLDDNLKGFFISKLTFNKKIDTSFSISKSQENKFGSVQLTDSNNKIFNFFLNQTSDLIQFRREYFEDLINTKAKIYGKTVKVKYVEDFTTIEHIICINKFLNISIYPNDIRKWIFVRAIFNNVLPKRFCKLSLNIEKTINSSFTICSVNIDNTNIGTVQFALEKI